MYCRHIYNLLTLIGVYAVCVPAYAQSLANAQTDEVGYLVGINNYFGDLNTNTSFRVARPAANIYYRHNFDLRLSWKTYLGYGYVYGNDAFSHDYYQHLRNLNFYSPIKEAGTSFEFNFLDYSTHGKKHRFSPYLSAGVCLFHFNPKTTLNGVVYDLQPLGTEGQNIPGLGGPNPYRLTSTAFLIGGGFKWRLNRSLCFTVDATQHKTSTKYLDDVSGSYVASNILYNGTTQNALTTVQLADRSYQVTANKQDAFTNGKMRGDGRKDSYLFIGIGISYTFGKYRCPFQE